jgi:hypothetical protein
MQTKRKQARPNTKNEALKSRKQPARIAKTRAQRYESLTGLQKDAYGRTANLVSDLRRGEGPYVGLLRKYHLHSRTARKYASRNLLGGTRGKPIRASKGDRMVRDLLFPMSSGDVPIRTRSSKDATKLSEFFHDRDKLLRGKLSAYDFEAKWRDVWIAGRELFADAASIMGMANADALKVEHLYASTSGER